MKTIITSLLGFTSLILMIFSFVLGPPFTILTVIFGILFILCQIAFNKKHFFITTLFGGLLNLAAISANGFQMPVLNPVQGMLDPAHTTLTEQTHLKLLCDVIPLGPSGHWAVASVGDVFVCIGTLLTLWIMVWYKRMKGA